MLRRNKNLCESPKKRCTPRDPAAPRASTPGSVNMKAAKELLRENYAEDVNGRLRAPGFITTLKGVTGRTQADKIANLRRVLATCRRVGIPLLKVNGSGFKSYRTLVSQCAVRMTQPVPNIFSERVGGTTQQRAVRNFKLLGRKAALPSPPPFEPSPKDKKLLEAIEGRAAVKNMMETIMNNVKNNNMVNDDDEDYNLSNPVFGFGRRLRFGNRRYGFGNRVYGFGNNPYMYY
jgi:hypothetical protein